MLREEEVYPQRKGGENNWPQPGLHQTEASRQYWCCALSAVPLPARSPLE